MIPAIYILVVAVKMAAVVYKVFAVYGTAKGACAALRGRGQRAAIVIGTACQCKKKKCFFMANNQLVGVDKANYFCNSFNLINKI